MEKRCGTRLCAPTLGIAFGVVTGLSLMLLAWAGMWWGYGNTFIDQYSLIYHGYGASWMGGLWGGLWGLIEGFIFGFILALVYNCVSCCCKCPCCKNGECKPNGKMR